MSVVSSRTIRSERRVKHMMPRARTLFRIGLFCCEVFCATSGSPHVLLGPEASGMDIIIRILWAWIGTPLPLDKATPDGRR